MREESHFGWLPTPTFAEFLLVFLFFAIALKQIRWLSKTVLNAIKSWPNALIVAFPLDSSWVSFNGCNWNSCHKVLSKCSATFQSKQVLMLLQWSVLAFYIDRTHWRYGYINAKATTTTLSLHAFMSNAKRSFARCLCFVDILLK